MQTHSESSTSETKQKIANIFRLVGWIAFWIELGLTIGSGIALLFSISGRNFATETNPGIGVGIFWAVAGLLALCFNVFLAFRYTRLAKGLSNPDPERHPRKADTVQILRMSVITSLVGILLCLLGSGATVGVLVSKAVSQPPGVALTDPNMIIRALDVFVAVANINGIAGHFVGIVTSLGLLKWIHNQ
ncbi:DUF3611 family protein [Cyanobacteria bacterium FACHB-472]|nr:DUF3611 family protein [Cyanobacteria bacterium FACHB-472]